MANKYLLDSSAWIEYFAGTAIGDKVREFLENEDSISTCILSIAEISDKFSEDNEKFDNFLAFLKNVSSIANLTVNSCSEAGKIKSGRRKTKKKFSLLDAVIYMTAKENSCILLTKDNDFENMNDVIILKPEPEAPKEE